MKPSPQAVKIAGLLTKLAEKDREIERLTAELTQVQNADGAVIKCLNDRMAALEAENAKLREYSIGNIPFGSGSWSKSEP